MSTFKKVLLYILSLIIVSLLIIGIFLLVLYLLNKKDLEAFARIFSNNLYCSEDNKNLCSVKINDKLKITVQPTLEYSKDLSKYCLDLIGRLAIIYYKNNNGITSIKLPPSLVLINKLTIKDKNPIIGYIALDNSSQNLYIVFRGTNDIKEWYKDLLFRQGGTGKILSSLGLLDFNKQASIISEPIKMFGDSSNNILCHKGFLEIYKQFQSVLLDIVSKQKINNIIITGHSLGSGLATLTALDLTLKNYKNLFVYVFASPRVGNIEFSETIKKSVNIKSFYRINNTTDVIPTVPYSVMPNSTDPNFPYFYQHCGDVIDFTKNTKSIKTNHILATYMNIIDT